MSFLGLWNLQSLLFLQIPSNKSAVRSFLRKLDFKKMREKHKWIFPKKTFKMAWKNEFSWIWRKSTTNIEKKINLYFVAYFMGLLFEYTILSDSIIIQICIGLFSYYLRFFLFFRENRIYYWLSIRHIFATIPIKLSVRGVNESKLSFFNLLLMD